MAGVLCAAFSAASIIAAPATTNQSSAIADSGASISTPTPPEAPTKVIATDKPSDAGNATDVTFTPAAVGQTPVIVFEIYRAGTSTGPWTRVGAAAPDTTATISFTDAGSADSAAENFLANNTDYYYIVRAVGSDTTVFTESDVAGPAQASGQWWNRGRTPVFVFVLLFTVLTIVFVFLARKNPEGIYIRPLGGIAAVDEAIGRATEMGRPILYVMGLGTASDIATIASFTVLGRVARRVAEYQTSLIVPCYDPIVFPIAQEIVRTGYLDAGRGEDYNEDQVFFVTQAQFAYVAAVNGTMLRERPATNFYLGKFYAESLLLAETGSLAGSIQISGTDEIAQLPFFVVACDYTLIGEELYAASAYLGREPLLLGALKAQDYAKAAIVILAISGMVAAGLQLESFVQWFVVRG